MAVCFIGNNQVYNIYLVWARDAAALHGFPVTWLVSYDAAISTAMLPLAVLAWRALGRRGIFAHELTKITGGAACAVLASLLLAAGAAWSARTGQKVPLSLLLGFHVRQQHRLRAFAAGGFGVVLTHGAAGAECDHAGNLLHAVLWHERHGGRAGRALWRDGAYIVLAVAGGADGGCGGGAGRVVRAVAAGAGVISGQARLAGVIGWPVAHSRSPVLHNAWLARYGIDGAYVPLAVAPGELAAAVRGLRGGRFCGGECHHSA